MDRWGLPQKFSCDGYDFESLTAKDISLLRQWTQMPHAQTWWTPSEEDLVQMEQDQEGDSKETARYTVQYQGRKFAYVQLSDLSNIWQDVWVNNPQPKETCAICQFTGDPEMIGFGHGTNYLKALMDEIFSNQVISIEKIVACPASDNTHAIQCFHQIGFRKESDIDIPTGPLTLMGRNSSS